MKKIIAVIAAVAAALSLAGCSKENLDNLSTFVEAGGRDYGDIITNEIGEAQRNTFFVSTVNDVEFMDEVGDYYVDGGYEFVAVDITVKNIFNQSIPMTNGDFYVCWSDTEIGWGSDYEDWNGPCEEYIAEDAYEDDFTLSVGEDYTGTLYFTIPTERSGKLKLVYEELYDDDFVGSTYIINLE